MPALTLASSITVQNHSARPKPLNHRFRAINTASDSFSTTFGTKKKEPAKLSKEAIKNELRKNLPVFKAGLKSIEGKKTANIGTFINAMLVGTIYEASNYQTIQTTPIDTSVIVDHYQDMLTTTNLKPSEVRKFIQQFRSEYGLNNIGAEGGGQNFESILNALLPEGMNVSGILGDKETPYIDALRANQAVKKATNQKTKEKENTKKTSSSTKEPSFWDKIKTNVGHWGFGGEKSMLTNPIVHAGLMVGGLFTPFLLFAPSVIGAFLFIQTFFSNSSDKGRNDEADSAINSLDNITDGLFNTDDSKKVEKTFNEVLNNYLKANPTRSQQSRGGFMKFVVQQAKTLPKEKCPKELNKAADSILYFKANLDEINELETLTSPTSFEGALDKTLIGATDEQKSIVRSIISELREKQGTMNEPSILEQLRSIYSLPWGIMNPINTELTHEDLIQLFNERHIGMPQIKERFIDIIEHDKAKVRINDALKATQNSTSKPTDSSAVKKLIAVINKIDEKNSRKRKPILLVGPPGVGKTSLGEIIAAGLGRKFVRESLSGVTEPMEIKGQSLNFMSSREGKIINGFKQAGTMNPVFMLDEIDKPGIGLRGDPLAPLLEIIDPQQNAKFKDDKIRMPFDVSHALFIATANSLDRLKPDLLDRFEIIHFSGYTIDEQVKIGQKLLERKLKQPEFSLEGLQAKQVAFKNQPTILKSIRKHPLQAQVTDELLHTIATRYPGGSGVRTMSECIDKLVESWFAKVWQQQEKNNGMVKTNQLPKITDKNLKVFIKNVKTVPINKYSDQELQHSRVGQIRGMYASYEKHSGGSTAFTIEQGDIKKKGPDNQQGLHLSAEFAHGDSLKLSAAIVQKFISRHINLFETMNPDLVEAANQRLYIPLEINVDEFAQKADGPSATTALTLAVISKLSGLELPVNLAITGSMTHQGKEGIIGGVMQKILGSYNEGITNFYVPPYNYDEYLDYIKFHPELDKKIFVQPFNHIYDIMNNVWVKDKKNKANKETIEFVEQFNPTNLIKYKQIDVGDLSRFKDKPTKK